MDALGRRSHAHKGSRDYGLEGHHTPPHGASKAVTISSSLLRGRLSRVSPDTDEEPPEQAYQCGDQRTDDPKHAVLTSSLRQEEQEDPDGAPEHHD